MRIGFIGLGRMGSLMVSRLLEQKIGVVATDIHPDAVRRTASAGATPAFSIPELVKNLPPPRIIWVMVPHGRATDTVFAELGKRASRGDILIDGGNTLYQDSLKRAALLRKKGIYLLDIGVSGGLAGARDGASLMAGGERKAYDAVEPLLKALAVPDGYGYMGKSGAGHFVKMVHNGIEYALLQSYGEGYQLVHASPFHPDLREVTKVWRNGSVIRSWLLELAQAGFAADPGLENNSGIVCGGSTGEWTVQAARKLKVPVPVLSLSLRQRIASRKRPGFSSKVIAMLRQQFGGHPIPPKGKTCEELGL